MKRTLVLLLAFSFAGITRPQTPKPTLADASPRVTEMNGGYPVDCTAPKVKIRFGSGRGEGYCQAVLSDLIKEWENGIDIHNLEKLNPPESVPGAPATAYELKGDKLGMSMAEYLQHHPDDCVARISTPPVYHHSAWSGNTIPTAVHQPMNAFHFHCLNLAPQTIATARMDWEEIDFSEQRLYRLSYDFSHDYFALIQAAFVQRFGSPSTTQQEAVQNAFGAQFTRATLVWKNGVSTIILSEIAGKDLTKSHVELTLDDIYAAVTQREGGKVVKAVQNDM